MKFTQIATAIALGLALSTAAQAAGTATDTFNVKITITGTCDAAAFTANATGDVDFGSHVADAASAALTANNTGTALAVLCSKNLPVTVGLTPSNANTTGAGVMSNGTDTIAYQLTQPTGGPAGPFTAAYATVWGADALGAGVNSLAVTGNGLAAGNAVLIPVGATVAANSLNVSAGNYTDAVTATLTY